MVLKATVYKQSSKQSLSKVNSEGAVRRCSSKKVLFKSKTHALESFFDKVEEETQKEVFSCEYCKIFKNSFYRTSPMAAFDSLIK